MTIKFLKIIKIECLISSLLVLLFLATFLLSDAKINYKIQENRKFNLKNSIFYSKWQEKKTSDDLKNKAGTKSTEIHQHGFVCDQSGLYSTFSSKESFFRIEFLVNQYTVEDLFEQECKAFQDFKHVRLPTNWKDQGQINSFVENCNLYFNAIRERDDVILCEILSTLLVFKYRSKF